MITFPNAKINIGLNIIKKRTDGFHNIETIFYPVKLSDILEINISNTGFNFTNTGLQVEGNVEDNLCYKAYQILKNDFDLPPVNIHLHKIIPFGAGLGGGSSNASFVLKLLNDMLGLRLSNVSLMSYAEQIGSDCPFFILDKPAYATEKGNIMETIDLELHNYFIVLIHPQTHVNTSHAYSGIIPKKPEICLKEAINAPIDTWKEMIENRFEKNIFKIHPEIAKIKERLYALGALYASMSGSGSSVYGIFKTKINVQGLFKNYFVWQGQM